MVSVIALSLVGERGYADGRVRGLWSGLCLVASNTDSDSEKGRLGCLLASAVAVLYLTLKMGGI